MAQIWIEIEENPNCGYLPLRTYSSIGEEQSARSVLLAYTEGGELTEVTGWGPDNGGVAVRRALGPRRRLRRG